jgi:hypothetical protein
MDSTDRKDALAVAKNATGHPRKHTPSGLYSWVRSKRLPAGRAFQATRRELAQVREDLIRERGGPEKITAGELILVDSIVEGLGVQKILGLYVRKYGVIDPRSAKRGQLELSPVLGKNWISYANTVRQGLLALGELGKAKGKDDGVPILAEYVRLRDAEKAQAGPDKPEDGVQDAQGGRTDGPEGDGQGQA